jgi:cobalt-zinc-cadmium efflux system membrane fusion protein
LQLERNVLASGSLLATVCWMIATTELQPEDNARTVRPLRAMCCSSWRFAAVLSLASACGGPRPQVDPSAPEPYIRRGERIVVQASSPLRSRLRVEAVLAEPVRRALETTAEVTVDPAAMTRIAPPMPGRITRLFVRFGDTVRAGQPLFTLDAPDLVAAQADYLRARSTVAQTSRTLARQQDLQQHGVGAQREVEIAQTDRDLATSELSRSTIRLRSLGMGPGGVGGPLTVRSPITGRIVDLHGAPGEFRNDLTEPVMTVADLSTVWVSARVQERDIGRVSVDEEASIAFNAFPGEPVAGRVRHVGDLLDPVTRTIMLRIALDNHSGKYRPGMFATVTLTENAEPELVVPTTAMVLIGDASYVFVERAPWEFERRGVQPGAQLEARTVVARGLTAGERIVVENAVLLQ